VEDRGKVYQEISSMIWSRSSPLTILALLVSLIYLRDTLRIFQGIITEIKVDGILKFIGDYDTVSVVFCAVEILSILIGLHALVMTINLIAMRLKR